MNHVLKVDNYFEGVSSGFGPDSESKLVHVQKLYL